MFISLFNERIRTGQDKLHIWQIQEMLDFAKQRQPGEIIRHAVVANNGSGKSSYLIAPCAQWLATHFTRGRSVVTSSSGPQLDRQTGASISHLAEQVNAFYDGEEVVKIRERFYTTVCHGGTVEMFATDEAGKAEGYHPHIGGDGEMGIFVDEGKSVGEHIYSALARCNGVTRRLDVSSPGAPQGHFFDCFTSPTWKTRRVTYLDCPHIHASEVEEALRRYGEFSPQFRSMYLAQFTSIEEQTVLQFEFVRRCFENFFNVREHVFGEPFAGVDLAGGGDENVLSVWHGNKHIGLEVFRYSHTPDTARHLITLFRKYGLQATNIVLDDGGLGKVLIDFMVEAGWGGLKRIRNEGRANDQMYGNRGAENWFNFQRIADKLLFAIKDETLRNQLANRYYTMQQGKAKLEDKRKARSIGHRSPDRADATILAFVGRWDNYLYDEGDRDSMLGSKRVPERLTQQELLELMEMQKFSGLVRSSRVQPPSRLIGKANFRAVLEARANQMKEYQQ